MVVEEQQGAARPIVCRELVAPLDRARAEEIAAAVKALADPARLQILSILRALPDGSACAGEFVKPLGVSAATVSHHLKVLHDAGFVTRERRGPWIYYRLPSGRINDLCGELL